MTWIIFSNFNPHKCRVIGKRNKNRASRIVEIKITPKPSFGSPKHAKTVHLLLVLEKMVHLSRGFQKATSLKSPVVITDSNLLHFPLDLILVIQTKQKI
jgi:hypothetical protein